MPAPNRIGHLEQPTKSATAQMPSRNQDYSGATSRAEVWRELTRSGRFIGRWLSCGRSIVIPSSLGIAATSGRSASIDEGNIGHLAWAAMQRVLVGRNWVMERTFCAARHRPLPRAIAG